MPVRVERRSGKKPWKIVEKRSGKVVGSSTSEKKALASARARNAALHGWKPTKGKRKNK
jgi:hypothetical protein